MIKELVAIGGTTKEQQEISRPFHTFIGLAVANAIVQGIVLASMIPALIYLLRGDSEHTYIWLGVFGAGTLITMVISTITNKSSFSSSMVIIDAMHRRLGEKLIKLPLGWFNADSTGRASHLAVKGTMFVATAAMDILVPLITNFVTPVVLVFVALAFDWRIGLVLLIGAPLVYGSSKLAIHLSEKNNKVLHGAQINTDTRLLEFGRAQVSLRAAGITGSEYAPLAEAIELQRKAAYRSTWGSVVNMLLQNFVVQLVFGIAVSLGIFLVIDPNAAADPVRTIAIIGLISQFVKPLQVIAEFGNTLRTTEHELADIAEILDMPGLAEPAPGEGAPVPTDPAELTIDLEDVHFRYRDDLPEVLRGASFTLPAGSLTALIGSSGSGKTTVTRLIARFWDINEGSIKIAGRDIRDYSTSDLMSMLSLVFQDIYLFDDTLEANIAYGNPAATPAEIRAAAERAGVTEIADRLPDGWDSRVGEGGRMLSGGERQRVSIARALLKKAPIVLFDEATASLDASMQKTVQDSIAELSATSTVLVIAHQLSTVQDADNIVVLHEGTVAEQGTHNELLHHGGRYADFWQCRDAAHGWVLTH